MKYFPLILRKCQWLDDSKIRPSAKTFFQNLHGLQPDPNYATTKIVDSFVKFALAAKVTLSRDFDPTRIRTTVLASLFEFRDAVTSSWGHEDFLPNFTAMFHFAESKRVFGFTGFCRLDCNG